MHSRRFKEETKQERANFQSWKHETHTHTHHPRHEPQNTMRQCGEELKSISILGLGLWIVGSDLQFSSFSIQQALAHVSLGSRAVNISSSRLLQEKQDIIAPYGASLQGSSSHLEPLSGGLFKTRGTDPAGLGQGLRICISD